MFGRGKKGGGGKVKDPLKSDQVRSHDQGLFGMPDLSEFAVKDDVDVSHEALEAELAALLDEDSDDDHSPSKMQRHRRPAPAKQIKTGDTLKSIEAMAADAMKEGDMDEDDDDDDDDALLAELADITSESDHPSPSLASPPSFPQKDAPGPTPPLQSSPAAASGLVPSPSAVKRSPSPARRPVPGPATSRPSATPKNAAEPTDLNFVLQTRGNMYQQAIKIAETASEGSKVRRYKRQLKTIQDMQKRLKQGKPIAMDEIPPEVYVPQPAAGPPEPQPPLQHPSPAAQPPAHSATSHPPADHPPTSHSIANEPSTSTDAKRNDSDKLNMLGERRDQYRQAALQAKQAGDIASATEHLKVSKQFDAVIHAIEAGQEVDLSEMPPPPSTAFSSHHPPGSSQASVPAPTQGASQGGADEVPRPTTDLEALQQRRMKYKGMVEKAKEEQNGAKERRIGRIVKQYEDAIRKHKLGKPVDFSELASLPEFPPFPSQSGGAPAQHPVQQHPTPAQPPPSAAAAAAATAAGQVSRAGQQGSAQPGRPAPPAPTRQLSAKENMYVKNVTLLKDRIAQYKTLALAAKRKGDVYEAKRLLKVAMEIKPMLAAAESGLPVNMDSIPKLPQKGEEHLTVSPPTSPEPSEDYEVISGTDAKDVYQRLVGTLNKQIDICKANAATYGKLGNIKSVKRFQEYEESCRQDLDLLIAKESRGEPIPRHHYEQRTLPSVRVCPDVKENEAEIVVVQGLQLHCPSDKDAKDIDTYVKVEFPYPSDEPQNFKTGWAKGTEQPVYNGSSTVDINRTSRAFNSAMKRKALKMEVIYSKGLLRGHKTLGTASLKLAELDNKCELHESVPLMDGRKEIGGKVEVKVRLHHPLTGIKEDFIKEKWLIIDSIYKKTIKASPSSSSSSSTGASSGSSQRSTSTDSIELLKWELSTLKKKIGELQSQKRPIPKEFGTSYTVLQERLTKLQTYLKEGGSKARQAYVSRLNDLARKLPAEAEQALQAGQKGRASMINTRRKLVEAEIASLTRR